ncbi:MAG: sortase [Actinomycetota bacterium]|nr:sortase [Actinomycetota bacterium]
MEKKRTPSRLLASLAFVALSGLAVSCGEEQPSGGAQEKPAQKAESAQKAPETPKKSEKTEPEKTEAEKTQAEKAKPEKTEPKKVEEPAAEQLPAGAGEVAEAAGDQYGAVTARQYEESQYEDDEESQYEDGEQPQEEVAEEDQYEDEEVAAAPSDTTMSLTVPALGISGVPVIDENSEAALTAGTMHLPGTGFPWQEGANTYIAGHRVGYAGTPSDRIFYDLPSISMGDEVTLTDANGETYNYAVSEIFAVTPFDTWVTGPTGTDTVSLQVCTETPDDWFTIGPRLMSSGPESGRLIVRATRV